MRRGDREIGRNLNGLGSVKSRVAEARLRAMFEQSPLAIGVFAVDGSRLLTNPAWEELWNLQSDETSASANVFEDARVRTGHGPTGHRVIDPEAAPRRPSSGF